MNWNGWRFVPLSARPTLLTRTLLAGVAACAPADPGDRHSAGATPHATIANDTPAEGDSSRIVVASQPYLTIGSDEVELFEVPGAARLDNGALVVANNGSKQVFIFDSSGRQVRSIGRDGEGPRELRAISRLFATGDSFMAYDIRLRRLIFGRADSIVRTVRMAEDSLHLYLPVGVLGDGSIVASAQSPRPLFLSRAGEMTAESTLIVRMSRDGRVTDSLVTVHLTTLIGWPIGRPEHVKFLAVGQRFAGRTILVGWGDRFVVGTGQGYELSVYDRNGRLQRVIRRRFEPRPVTKAVEAQFLEYLAGSMSADAIAQSTYLTESPPAEFLPAYSQIIGDSKGLLWVREYTIDDDGDAEWSIFDESGVWLSSIALPRNLRVTQIGEDWLIGVARDADGLEQVEIRRLSRGQ